MKEIPLTRGEVALVDDEDFDRVSHLKWGVVHNGSRFYARHAWQRQRVWEAVLMHRLILDAPDGMHVDHVNGNGLDNRRDNLRLVTPSQNQRNRKAGSTTGYKGVTRMGRWYQATIQPDGQRFVLGNYPTAEEAARVYDAAAFIVDPVHYRRNFSAIDSDALRIARHVLDGGKPSDIFRNPHILSDDDVREMRRLYAAGGVFIREIADEYGVSKAAVQHALSGRNFGHITDPAPIRGDKRRRKAA